ncbi:MAG: hypothetical protein CMJ59_20125 [Planctomycetaceae bacterium]|nr:hypothetical protein [Planctomycetaceae bacterium]
MILTILKSARCWLFRRRWLACCLGLSMVSPASAGSSNSLMDVSADGRLLACSNRDSGTLTIVDLRSHHAVREVPVGAKPEGVSFIGDSHRVAVAAYAEDAVVLIDADSGALLHRTAVFDEPYGVVSDRAGKRVYVTLDYPGRVVEIDAASGKLVRELQVGRFLRGIAITPDQRRLLVTEYYTTRIQSIDLATGEVNDQWTGARTDNLSRQIVVHPNRPKAYFPHLRSRVKAVHGEGSIFPYLSVVDTVPGPERRRKRIPMDAFLGNLVTSNPWEVALSHDGRQVYIVFSGTNDLFACRELDDNYREIEFRKHLQLGHNPRAVRVSPDNKTVYVYNALDFNVVAYDTEKLEVVATIPVCENPLGEQILEGKVLFYSALQPMVGRRWISCSSCHPDGDADGRTWHNPEGLRNTQSFAGMAWTHPIHWSADRDEVQDFEHTIRGKLMQGRGLISGEVRPQLGEPNSGLSASLDALAAYSNSHKFTLSPYASGGLNAAARRGQALFASRETNCASCHSGPFYSDSRPRQPKAIVRHDVGTGKDDETEKMGPEYDTPTLLGLYRTAPYLHHGRAVSLRDVLTTFNRDDHHGRTSHLTGRQIDDVVEFLKALPYQDPEIEASQLGLEKVR